MTKRDLILCFSAVFRHFHQAAETPAPPILAARDFIPSFETAADVSA